MIMILFKSLGKRTSIGLYYDEKSLTKCYCPRPCGSFGSTCQLYSQLCIIEKSEKH